MVELLYKKIAEKKTTMKEIKAKLKLDRYSNIYKPNSVCFYCPM